MFKVKQIMFQKKWLFSRFSIECCKNIAFLLTPKGENLDWKQWNKQKSKTTKHLLFVPSFRMYNKCTEVYFEFKWLCTTHKNLYMLAHRATYFKFYDFCSFCYFCKYLLHEIFGKKNSRNIHFQIVSIQYHSY